jgi:hypothetical protein
VAQSEGRPKIQLRVRATGSPERGAPQTYSMRPGRALAAAVALAVAPLPRAQKADGVIGGVDCDLASLQVLMTDMTAGCCAGRGQELNCPPGQVAPNVCDAACAESFEPFWDSCGSLLQTMSFPGVDEYAEFADRCWESLFTPGACSAGCDAGNFDCLALEVTEACCSTGNPQGCTDGIPHACDFECSIKLRPFIEACDDSLLSSQLPADTVATLQAAASQCTDQDPAAILNHAYELQEEQQCTIDLSAIVAVGGSWHAATEDGHQAGECSEIQEAIVRRCIASCDDCNMAPTLIVVGDCTGYQANGEPQTAHDLIGVDCASGPTVGASGAAKLSVPDVTVTSVGAVPTYVTYQLAVRLPAAAANLYNINGSPGNPMQIPAAFQVPTPFGSDIGGTNPAFWAITPTAQYDSWLTVGVTDGTSAEEISTAGIDFASWTDSNLPITSSTGVLQYLNPQNGPVNVPGASIVIAQLTLPERGTRRATINLKGKDQHGGDWQLDGIQFTMCNSGTGCGGGGGGGGGHRRQLQLSQWTHNDKLECDYDAFDEKTGAMDAVCCPQGDCGSSGGVPQECSLDCAVLFSNVYNNCHDTLDNVVGLSMPLFDHFIEKCYQLVSAHEIEILDALGAAECPDDDVGTITDGGVEGNGAGPHTDCGYSLQSCMAVATKVVTPETGSQHYQTRFQYHDQTLEQCETLCKCVDYPLPSYC